MRLRVVESLFVHDIVGEADKSVQRVGGDADPRGKKPDADTEALGVTVREMATHLDVVAE